MERTEEMTRASGPATPLEGHYIDWAAVFGGGVVAVAVGSVLTGFGAALGLSTISAEPGEGSFNLMLIVSAIWIVVSLVASYATGGYIAGRMRRRLDKAGKDEVTARDGVNGLVVWGLGMIASVFLLTSAVSTTVSTIGAGAQAAGSAMGAVAETAGTVVAGVADGAISAAGAMVPDEATANPADYISNSLLRPAQVATGSDPAAAAASAASILGNVVVTGEVTDAERAYLVSAVVASTGATQPEATARVDEAVTAAQQTRADAEKLMADAQAEAARLAQEAEVLAVRAAETARVSAILTAFILAAAALVAAAAAYVGAVRGGRHRDEGRIYGGFAYRG